MVSAGPAEPAFRVVQVVSGVGGVFGASETKSRPSCNGGTGDDAGVGGTGGTGGTGGDGGYGGTAIFGTTGAEGAGGCRRCGRCRRRHGIAPDAANIVPDPLRQEVVWAVDPAGSAKGSGLKHYSELLAYKAVRWHPARAPDGRRCDIRGLRPNQFARRPLPAANRQMRWQNTPIRRTFLPRRAAFSKTIDIAFF